MIFFLIVLLGAGVVAGFYAHQNPGSTDVSLFGWQWSGVTVWVPVVIAAGGIALVAVLTLVYQRWRIAALRHSLLELRAETLAQRQGAAARADAPLGDGHVIGRRAVLGRWLGRRRDAATPPPEAAARS
jgi:hypothetical protein